MAMQAGAIEWRYGDAPEPYDSAVEAMERRIAAIREGTAPELVWLLEHPSLYTAGTSARAEDLIEPERLPVYRSGRGGQYTYHGPGQRVAYVLLDLNRRGRDVRCHVWRLEEWIVAALARFNVRGERRQGRVGVWIAGPDGRDDKIAAIGVRVGMIGFQREHPVIARDRLAIARQCVQGHTAVVPCADIVRLDGERGIVTRDSILDPAHIAQRVGAIVLCRHIARIDRDRTPHKGKPGLMLAALRFQYAQEMQRVRLIRGYREDLAIELLGIPKLPLLMQGKRLPQLGHQLQARCVEVRAQRRWKEHQEKGDDLTVFQVLEEVRQRDKRDRERKVSPLVRAADAVIVDNTAMDVEETARLIVMLAREREKEFAGARRNA